MSDTLYGDAKKTIAQGGMLTHAMLLDSHALFSLAIANNDYLMVRKIIQQLESKKDDSVRILLLNPHQDNKDQSPLIAASKLTNPQIFDYLLGLNPGYSLDTLQAVKHNRKKVRAHQRRWGMIVAFFMSACPSKSLADAMNVPQVIVGLGFTISASLLAAVALPACILGLSGLACISIANYKKLKVEQNIADKTLDVAMLQAELDNFQKKVALYDETAGTEDDRRAQRKVLLVELENLKTSMIKHSLLKKVSRGNKKNNLDFLTAKDKIYRNIATLGEALSTNLGFLGLAAFVISSASLSFGLPIIVTVISALVVMGITLFYIKNEGQQSKELVNVRRAEFDLEEELYKSLKHFMYDKDNGFSTAIILAKRVDSTKGQALRASFDEVFKKLAKTKGKEKTLPNQKIEVAVMTGDRRLFKRLIFSGVETLPVSPGKNGNTLLHTAVRTGNLIIIEEMLGLSMASKMRNNKRNWVLTTNEQGQCDALQKKRLNHIEKYEALITNSRKMLLLHDKNDNLPLHIAAGFIDPTLYYMLLKQPVLYSTKDLEKAFKIRKNCMNKARRAALVTALLEAICPGSSLREILFSVSFVALALGSVAASVGIGVASAIIFGGMVYANYQKAKLERAVATDLEQIIFDKARIAHIEMQLQALQAKVHNGTLSHLDAQKEHDIWMHAKRNIRKKYPVDTLGSTKGSLITRGDKINAYICVFGAFLCAYAGTLGLIELATTAFVMTLSGPVGWGLLVGAFVAALIIASVYVHNRKQELSIFAERRQNVQIKKENMFDRVDELSNEINSTLNIRGIITQSTVVESPQGSYTRSTPKNQQPLPWSRNPHLKFAPQKAPNLSAHNPQLSIGELPNNP